MPIFRFIVEIEAEGPITTRDLAIAIRADFPYERISTSKEAAEQIAGADQPCGHSKEAIVACDEGTHYCSECVKATSGGPV